MADVSGPRDDAVPRIARAIELAAGTALVAALAAAIGVERQLRAFEDLPSAWTQARVESAQFVASVAVGLLVVVVVADFGLWLVRGRRRDPRRWRRRVVGIVGPCLLLVSGAIALTVNDTYYPERASGSVATVAVLALVAVVGLRWSYGRISILGRWRLVAALAAVLACAAVLVVPPARHPIPARDLIDWWAAHDNPPLGYLASISAVGDSLRADHRDVSAVEAACRDMGRDFRSMREAPRAPSSIVDDVAQVSRDLEAIAQHCLDHADTTTADELQTMLEATTADPAAERINKALHLSDENLG